MQFLWLLVTAAWLALLPLPSRCDCETTTKAEEATAETTTTETTTKETTAETTTKETETKDNTNNLNTDTDRNPHADDKCGLYLAPSTIEGAGLGLFVTAEKNEGDVIPASGDVAIPLVDLLVHRGRDEFFNMFQSYTWSGTFFGMGQESDFRDENIVAHAPGLNSAINCHPALTNAGREFPIHDPTYQRIARHNSPNAGAMTPYFNGTTRATARIPAGGELFKFYGKQYFTSRLEEYGPIPLPDDYTKAQHVCRAWHFHLLPHRPDRVKDALWIMMRALLKQRTAAADSGDPKRRFFRALPPSPALARQCARRGIRSLHQPAATRSLEDLRLSGRCQDSIRAGPSSTIPGAGRGAFAARSFPKDSIVTGSPLLHIPKRDFTYMYDVKWVKGKGWRRRFNKRIGTQLVVNYCWGHVDSTILLCPYGAGVNFINHAPNPAATDGSEANATSKQPPTANIKLQWAPHGIMSHNDSWVLHHGHVNMYQSSVNLAVDYVALRDIDEGEELLVDYGPAWERAWQHHVDEWEPPDGDSDRHYAPAAAWNVRMVRLPLKTIHEQQYEPYPRHILLHCHSTLRRDDHAVYLKALGGRDNKFWSPKDYGFPCDIIARHRRNVTAAATGAAPPDGAKSSAGGSDDDDDYVYTVEFYSKKSDSTVTRDNVPRLAFRFLDVPYSTDIHLSTAFRYPAQLPEHMVPDAWRNDVGGEAYRL